MHGLAETTLDAYRAAFLQAVADGRRRQLVLPQILVGCFLLPILWLAIPHTRRPWLYQTRWLVVAVALGLNAEQVLRASSTNIAGSYSAGLVAAYGSMLCMHLLVWTRPQFDAARVIKVCRRGASESSKDLASTDVGAGAGAGADVPADQGELRRRNRPAGKSNGGRDIGVGNDTSVYEYRWQRFPHNGTFLQRLGWAVDLILCFRGAGWTWSAPVIPRPRTAGVIRDGDRVDMKSMPRITTAGYERKTTEAEFFQSRLTVLALSCLLLDFLSTFMVKDPYFILGPDGAASHSHANPWYVAGLSPWMVQFYHELFALSGMVSAISAAFAVMDMLQYWVLKTWFPSRCIVEIFASTFGSLDEVFERGLAGWWGSWWHQSFRQQLLGPSTYLIANGYLRKGAQSAVVVSLLVSFVQSGILHTAGSLTTLPATKPWRPMAFFLLQAAGIVVQQESARVLGKLLSQLPRRVARWTNFAFAIVWLYATAPLFIDDIAACGIWLLEPVPVSVFRALGFGRPGDHWWRWDHHYAPRWFTGRICYESGVGV